MSDLRSRVDAFRRLEGFDRAADGRLTPRPVGGRALKLPAAALSRSPAGELLLSRAGELAGRLSARLLEDPDGAFRRPGRFSRAFSRATGRRLRPVLQSMYLYRGNGASGEAEDVSVLPRADPRLAKLGFDRHHERVFAVEERARVIAACVSVRFNDEAEEPWVMTVPAARRRGCARRLVGAWARQVAAGGRLPFYCHESGHEGSRRVALAAGFELQFEELAFYGEEEP